MHALQIPSVVYCSVFFNLLMNWTGDTSTISGATTPNGAMGTMVTSTASAAWNVITVITITNNL